MASSALALEVSTSPLAVVSIDNFMPLQRHRTMSFPVMHHLVHAIDLANGLQMVLCAEALVHYHRSVLDIDERLHWPIVRGPDWESGNAI